MFNSSNTSPLASTSVNAFLQNEKEQTSSTKQRFKALNTYQKRRYREQKQYEILGGNVILNPDLKKKKEDIESGEQNFEFIKSAEIIQQTLQSFIQPKNINGSAANAFQTINFDSRSAMQTISIYKEMHNVNCVHFHKFAVVGERLQMIYNLQKIAEEMHRTKRYKGYCSIVGPYIKKATHLFPSAALNFERSRMKTSDIYRLVKILRMDSINCMDEFAKSNRIVSQMMTNLSKMQSQIIEINQHMNRSIVELYNSVQNGYYVSSISTIDEVDSDESDSKDSSTSLCISNRLLI